MSNGNLARNSFVKQKQKWNVRSWIWLFFVKWSKVQTLIASYLHNNGGWRTKVWWESSNSFLESTLLAVFIYEQNSYFVLLFWRFLQYRRYISPYIAEIFKIETKIAILIFKWTQLICMLAPYILYFNSSLS